MLDALAVLAEHHQLFSKQILNDAKEIFDLIFTLCNNTNRDIKERAADAMEAITMEVDHILP